MKSFFQRRAIHSSPSPIISSKMSRTYKVTVKSFCKVCYDNDKPEKEFRSHNVRNKQGKVCCPTLLSVVCAYCGIKGHGPKYCTRLAKDRKEAEQPKPVVNKPVTIKKTAEKAPMHSKFSALEMSSDSDSEEEPVEKLATKPSPAVAKPSITKPASWAKPATAPSTQPRKTNWADMYDSEEED